MEVKVEENDENIEFHDALEDVVDMKNVKTETESFTDIEETVTKKEKKDLPKLDNDSSSIEKESTINDIVKEETNTTPLEVKIEKQNKTKDIIASEEKIAELEKKLEKHNSLISELTAKNKILSEENVNEKKRRERSKLFSDLKFSHIDDSEVTKEEVHKLHEEIDDLKIKYEKAIQEKTNAEQLLKEQIDSFEADQNILKYELDISLSVYQNLQSESNEMKQSYEKKLDSLESKNGSLVIENEELKLEIAKLKEAQNTIKQEEDLSNNILQSSNNTSYLFVNSPLQPCITPKTTPDMPVLPAKSYKTAGEFIKDKMPVLYNILQSILKVEAKNGYDASTNYEDVNNNISSNDPSLKFKNFAKIFKSLDDMPRRFPLVAHQCRILVLILQLNFIDNTPFLKQKDIATYDLFVDELSLLTGITDRNELMILTTESCCGPLISLFRTHLNYPGVNSDNMNNKSVGYSISNAVPCYTEAHMNLINLINSNLNCNDSYNVAKKISQVITDIRKLNNMDKERLKKNEEYIKKNLQGNGSRVAKKLITDSLQIINNLELLLLSTSTFCIAEKHTQQNMETVIAKLDKELTYWGVDVVSNYEITKLNEIEYALSTIINPNAVPNRVFGF